METKRIQCPKCQCLLDVRNSKDEAVKIITCPQCHTQLQVIFKKQPPTPPIQGVETRYVPGGGKIGETQYGGRTTGDGATRLSPSSPSSPSKHPRLIFQNQSYALAPGVNTVGRKASTSTATVQIATHDLYMSRSHVRINVVNMPDGSIKAILSNDRNKNITSVKGQPLQDGDKIILSNGDEIKMGDTLLIYKEE
jgi:pSer/pThr/pTyr-binding forkhead associated (FHA) protein